MMLHSSICDDNPFKLCKTGEHCGEEFNDKLPAENIPTLSRFHLI